MSISPAATTAAPENGKLQIRQNATKHGIFSSIALLAHEDRQSFDALLHSYLKEHKPSTATEFFYVQEMADAGWRLNRIRHYSVLIQEKRLATIEKSEPSDPQADAAESFYQLAENSKSLHTLLRYEIQFRRQFDRSLNQLLKLRSTIDSIHAKASAEWNELLAAHLNAPTPGELQPPLPPSSQPLPPEAPPIEKLRNEKLQNEPKPADAIPPATRPIGRNTLCPCESGRKFKACCGRNAPPILHSQAA